MDTIEINIKSNAAQVEKETKSLRQQVKELKQALEQTAVGSEEYAQTLQKLANVTHEYREQQEMIKNSAGDLGTAFSNMQGVATGIAAGFSSVNAAMSLMGTNSEDLQKTMVKLQAGIALVQGMKGLEGMGKKITGLVSSVKAFTVANKAMAASEEVTAVSTNVVSKAFKGLKAALLSSGIGGIIVLVGALIAGMSALVGVIRSNLQVENEFKDTNEQLNNSFNEQNDALDLQIKYLQADGASTSEIIAEKQKLTQAQIDETKAALENARARLSQLKSDSAWRRFWHGENKVIKELEKETIPELEKTLEGLEKKSANLAADLYTENKRVQNKITSDRQAAAQKALAEAEREAEKHKKLIEDTGKSAEETFANVLKAYKKLHSDMNNVRSALNLSTDGWKTIYGTDAKSLEADLAKTDHVIAVYAADDLFKNLQEQLDGVDNADLRKTIVEKYIAALQEAGHDISNLSVEAIDTQDGLVKPLLGGADEALILSTRETVDTFKNQFESLKTLYQEGIIDYKEFYDTFLNVVNNYKTKIGDTEKSMIVLPLDLQKEVGDKFITELNRQLKKIDEDSDRFWSDYNRKTAENLIKNTSAWKTFWGESATSTYNAQKQFLEDENTQYKKEYEARRTAIENMLNDNALTVEQKQELNNQLNALDDEKLQHDAEYYKNKKDIANAYYANLLSVASTTFSAAANLISSINENVNNKINKLKDKASKALAEGNEEAAKKFDEEAKKEFETSQKLQIAQSIISGAAGVAQAIAGAMQLGPIAGPIVGPLNAAAVIASTVAQIAAIKNTKYESALGSSESSTSSATSTPDTSFTLTSADAYQNTLSDETQSDLQANAQQNQRVYVVSSDISDAQNNEKTTVTTATF